MTEAVPRIAPEAWPRALFSYDGMMRIEADLDRWFIPDRHGIWIPSGTSTKASLIADLEYQAFLIAPRFAARLAMPDRPTVLHASPLIRGIGRRLMLIDGGAALRRPAEWRRLCWAALDELARLERPDFALPGSGDPRLAQVMTRLLVSPAETSNLGRLAANIGTSERTLSRLFQKETGLNWREWRDRLRFFLAIEGLQSGRSSTDLANWLGYSSPSAFVAAFKRRSGNSPKSWRRGL
ncbi:AraC family transcriptional regulator [Thioclava litoralis]|uniref:AraC family transcriptional regulator n=1 Tax=Thioclava litoralis TaxID=3076557 RepID=A0ABZ1DZ96_9RHOB|nr:AraC family transcriptional regulator [Thioclava sp. FTW29]